MGIMEKLSSLLPARNESRARNSPARNYQGRNEYQDRRAPHTQALMLKDDFDHWLQRFFQEPWGYGIEYPGAALPEVRETEKEFVVRVEVPGFDPSDLELSLRSGALVITGARRDDGEEQTMIQSVSLPPDVDAERAEARVDRGVLTIRMPRTQSAGRMRRIPVSTGQARNE